jgi:hypothetical protein
MKNEELGELGVVGATGKAHTSLFTSFFLAPVLLD